MQDDVVSARCVVNDVQESIDFYTHRFGFELHVSAAPASADLLRGRLRLLLVGPESSAGWPMPDHRDPAPGGWNPIHFSVEDIASVNHARVGSAT